MHRNTTFFFSLIKIFLKSGNLFYSFFIYIFYVSSSVYLIRFKNKVVGLGDYLMFARKIKK